MAEYRKYLKDWTSERGITSYLGSDKSAFQQDWKEAKRDSVRFGEEVSSMGGEDINRAGEPFKKPKPKRNAAETVLTNPDLLKQIGAFTNPGSVYPKLINELILKYEKIIAKASKGKGGKKLVLDLKKLNKVGRDKSGNIYLKESSKYFQDKYGDGWAIFHPTAFKDKYWSIEDKIIDLKNKAEELLS